jgi:hypothetical protein
MVLDYLELVPIAKYDKNTTGFDRLNNQFVLNIGASFNL